MTARNDTVLVVGVGMIPFSKPSAGELYDEMAAKAVGLALADAGIGYDQVQQCYAGYVYGDSCAGNRALYRSVCPACPFLTSTATARVARVPCSLRARRSRAAPRNVCWLLDLSRCDPGRSERSFPTARHPLPALTI